MKKRAAKLFVVRQPKYYGKRCLFMRQATFLRQFDLTPEAYNAVLAAGGVRRVKIGGEWLIGLSEVRRFVVERSNQNSAGP